MRRQIKAETGVLLVLPFNDHKNHTPEQMEHKHPSRCDSLQFQHAISSCDNTKESEGDMRINYQGGALFFISPPHVSVRATLIKTELHSHTVRTLTCRTSLNFDWDDQNAFSLKSDWKITQGFFVFTPMTEYFLFMRHSWLAVYPCDKCWVDWNENTTNSHWRLHSETPPIKLLNMP